MNPTTNMLSAKKVKVHGMSTSKWTTKDKITQYKGLVNLYKRDKQIMEVDIVTAQKKQRKELEALQKSITDNRNDLMNAIKGDRQALHNTLAEYQNFQLAYESTPPEDIIENINHISFIKRKEYDRLQYEMKIKSQRLIDLKLRKSILEDRIKFFVWGHTEAEKQAEILSGKVQDVRLRKEAALAIRQIYNRIIDIMKKDALYFDAILIKIKSDGAEQSKCMINATELGQLATEYVDDRKEEYRILEEVVLKDMQVRRKDLDTLHEQDATTNNNLKLLLSRDSDINSCVQKVEKTESEINLQNELYDVEEILKYLKGVTLVASYEDIYKCLQTQAKQKERLTGLIRRYGHIQCGIMVQLEEAELTENMMEDNIIESTFDYRERKLEITNNINDERNKQEELNNLVAHRKNLIAKITFHLLQLQQILELIQSINETKKTKVHKEDETIKSENEDIDARKMLQILTTKLNLLVSYVDKEYNERDLDEAYKFYETLMKRRAMPPIFELDSAKNLLLDDLYEESSNILTRDDIKQQSDEIVAENTKSDDLVPMSDLKKKSKKKSSYVK